MGRRKSAAKPKPKKKQPTVAKVFKCLFCSNEGSVTCTMNFQAMLGELKCRICDPIDVFSEWLDETADLQLKANKQMRTGRHPTLDDDEDPDSRIRSRHDERSDEGDVDGLLNEFDDDED